MSRFYGQVFGQAQTSASRRGSKEIKVSAQSWNGSVITSLYYNENDELMVNLSISDGSSSYGYTHFDGTLDELKERLAGVK
jgi:hypothetical protein